ncbi:hypothetical protein NDU88_009737 [Pleurodeles waltl]|uniref:Secreted protein n=1 Tax=Pleurodeles waltl TaxID=8319 RepID=A0AAV7QYD3_PLEWA|nr:hypothetical protein NDU88_009737 [Pleurodeles waltl]
MDWPVGTAALVWAAPFHLYSLPFPLPAISLPPSTTRAPCNLNRQRTRKERTREGSRLLRCCVDVDLFFSSN